MNRAVFALVAILCLFSVSSTAGLIRVVKADGAPIYINADGSISPSTAPIYTADNITYTLTSNITAGAGADGIDVETDNIILDGAGYTLTGGGIANGIAGIAIIGRSNVTVRNITITDFGIGIALAFVPIYPTSTTGNSSEDNTLLDNNIANDYIGISLDLASDNNVLSGNNVTASSVNGIVPYISTNNILSGNTVANSGTGIVLSSSDNNTIYHNNFINNTSQAYSIYNGNIWDNGSSGNYWSDYLTKYPNATQVDSSGVWNTPYVIDTNNTDRYPLTTPYGISESPTFPILRLFIVVTVVAVIVLLAVIIFNKKKGVKRNQIVDRNLDEKQ